MGKREREMMALITADCDQKAEVLTDWLAAQSEENLDAIANVFLTLANASCGMERMALLAALNDKQLAIYTTVAAVGLEHFHRQMLAKQMAIEEFEE